MSAGHALRGAASAWLGLIALSALASAKNGQVTGLVGTATTLLSRAFDPTVPAIPDRRTGTVAPAPASSGAGYMTPAQAAAAARASATSQALTGVTNPGGLLGSMPSLSTYAHGGLPAGILDNPALRGG